MRGLVFVTTAMPAYWVGLLLMWLISVKLGLLPTNGSGTLRHLILPAFTVALSYISTYIRLIRNNMLENMKQMCIRDSIVSNLLIVKSIICCKNQKHFNQFTMSFSFCVILFYIIFFPLYFPLSEFVNTDKMI